MTIYVPGKVTLKKEFTWNETVWNPSMLSTALWLDAADASTITESGGAVSQWNDKSGNARHAAQGTAGSRPVLSITAQNSLNAVSFDGSDDFFSLASALPLASSGSFDVFFAGKPNDVSLTPGIVTQRPGVDAAGGWIVRFNQGQIGVIHFITSGVNGSGYVRGGSISANVNYLASWTFDSAGGATSANQWSMRIDAGAPVTETIGSSGSGWVTANGEIGRIFPGASYSYAGLMYEIVITASAASTSNRQRIEGYLAHKWGLTANLPSDHPYKLVGPTP